MGGAAVALLGFTKDAAESARVGRQTEAVIKSTGGKAKITADQVGNLATAISNKTGADDEAIQSGENMLLTFTGVRNEVGKGNDIFNQATQTATDMAAAMNGGQVTADGLKTANIQLGKALNDPIKGIGALSKVGVSFTAQQKKQIETMVKAGHTAEAQKVILRELGTEFGGQAEAAADPMVKLQTVLGNVAETLGTILLPYVEKGSVLMAKFGTWVANNQGKVKAFVVVAAILGTTILGVNVALRAYRAGQALLIAVTRGAMYAQLAFNAAMNLNPVSLIVLAVIALGVAIVVCYRKFDTFRYGVNAIVKALAGTWLWWIDTIILGGLSKMMGALGHLPGPMGAPFRAAKRAIDAVRGGLDSLRDKVNALPTSKSMEVKLHISETVTRSKSTAPEDLAFAQSEKDIAASRRRAAGGPVSAGTTYLVGERGPEMLVMGRQGGHVIPSGRGGGDIRVHVVLETDEAGLKARVRKIVRVEGGGSVQAAFGRA